MPLWKADDLTVCTIQEVLLRQAENREWSKELRRKSNLLVTSRLAKSITQDEYLAGRNLAQQDMDECQRRAAILSHHIARRAAIA